MKNQFEDAMSKRSDEDLQKIVSSQTGDYQPEAVKAAEKEIRKREFINAGYLDKISKCTDEEILEILKSRNNYQEYQVAAADKEAKKRNLNFNYEAERDERDETILNEEILNLKTDVGNERYPALRFIVGVYRLLAWIVLFATVIILAFFYQDKQIDVLFYIGGILIGGILFVSLLAAAEGILVFMDIEHNTRITAVNSKK